MEMDYIILLIVLIIIALAAWRVQKILSQWQTTGLLILTLLSLLLAPTTLTRKIDTIIKTQKEILDTQETMIITLNEIKTDIKRLRETRQDSLQDSILVRLERIDACIDSHFIFVNRRLDILKIKLE